jgi:glycosyltransferase involved in cell wall biosynthesis
MCSKVVAISGAVFKLLVNAGIKPEKITILRHGKTVPKTMDFKEACKITGLNPERKFILCSGRLSDEKNQLLAVESFAKLIKGNPDTTRMMDLIILGKDFDKGSSYLQQIRKRAEELKISNRIITPGHVLNVEPWLRASMLGLVTSRTEGLSYSMIEYMAASIPVISTPCEGPLEIIESGRNGFIAPANPEDFAKSIMNSIDKPTYEKLSKGAYETWKEFFNHEAMVARLDQIYRDSLM